MKLSALLAAVACLACACATAPAPNVIELQPVADFEVAYSGQLGRHAVGDLPEYTQPDSNTGLMFELEVRVLRGQAARAETAFGQRVRTIGAWTMDAGVSIEGMSVISAPRLTVFEGQSGTISMTNETAYISGFELRGEGDARVADPVIDTILDGLVLGLRAEAAGDEMRLKVDLTLAEIVTPMATQKTNVMGSEVTIQTPVIYSQRMKAEGKVRQDKVLVLTGMAGGDEVYVVLVTGKRVSD